jgi:protein-disulfide isomerase/uncharacterized membrane protein
MQQKTVSISFALAFLMALGAAFMWSQDNTLGALICAIGAGWVSCFGAGLVDRWFGLASSGLLALLVSLYLGVQHKGIAGKSICSVSQTFDCDKVNTSEFSELFDIPIAFLGSSFYAAVIVLAFLCLRGGAYKNAAHLIAVGGLGSVVYSAFLAFASVQLGAWCLFCISLYGLNALILYLALGLVRESDMGMFAGAFTGSSSLNLFAGVGAVMLVGTMGWYSAGEEELPQGDSVEDLSGLFHGAEGPVILDGTEPTYGADGAKYQVVEFADYECPYCGRLFPAVHNLPTADSDIQIVFKHYPLSGMCNEGLSPDRHVHACGAARAADCANRQNLFWEFSAQMFKNQKDLDREGLMIMAKLTGLDVEALGQCMDDPMTAVKVKTDVAHGSAAGVHSTPSLFLKGLYGDEWVSVSSGPEGVAKLVAAHKAGKVFPAQPPKAKPHSH